MGEKVMVAHSVGCRSIFIWNSHFLGTESGHRPIYLHFILTEKKNKIAPSNCFSF
jgi:hypothetical protein